MAYIFDLALLLIFLAFIYYGMVKGFIKTALSMVAGLLSFYLSYALSPLLAEKFYDMFLSQRVYEAIAAKVGDASASVGIKEKTAAVLNSLPSFAVNLASSIGIGVDEINDKVKALDTGASAQAVELANKVAAPIATAVLQILFFVLLIFILRLLFSLAIRLLSKIFKLPVLKSFNRVLGGLFGGVKGLLVVFVICIILGVFVTKGSEGLLVETAAQSKILSLINERNFLAKDFIY